MRGLPHAAARDREKTARRKRRGFGGGETLGRFSRL